MNKVQKEIINMMVYKQVAPPGGWAKKFLKDMFKLRVRRKIKISEKQNEWIFRLLYKYRKKLPELYEKYKDNKFCGPRLD